jgi:hypothetical protein
LNGDTIVQDFTQTWKRRDWFQQQAPPQIMDQTMMGQDQTKVATEMTPDKPQTPSVNALEGQMT